MDDTTPRPATKKELDDQARRAEAVHQSQRVMGWLRWVSGVIVAVLISSLIINEGNREDAVQGCERSTKERYVTATKNRADAMRERILAAIEQDPEIRNAHRRSYRAAETAAGELERLTAPTDRSRLAFCQKRYAPTFPFNLVN